MMGKYKVTAEFGIPYEEEVGSDAEMRRKLLHFKKMSLSGKYPYLKVSVYSPKGVDITGRVFKKFKL